MLPSSFEYHRPTTIDEALDLLEELGEDAKVLAGGQSLIPMMKLRFAAPAHLVDINRVEGLDGIEERDGELHIGALVRHNQLVASTLLRDRYPMIAAAAPQIADPLVRNLGTIGGSLAHCDPSGDLGAVMLAANGRVVLKSKTGEREVPVIEFLASTFQSSIEPNEILTSVRVTSPTGSDGGTYLKLERKVGDYATVAVATRLLMTDGSIGSAGIGLTSVGLTNIKATAAEDALAGQAPSQDLFAEAGRLAAAASSPVSDVRGQRDVQAPHGRGVRPPRPDPRRRDGRRRLIPPADERTTAMEVTITVNGTAHTMDIEPRMLLVHVIREQLRLTGTHIGCDSTSCGACTILYDGTPVKSCTLFGVQADGVEITTVEGLLSAAGLDPMQAAFKEHHGLQCGYCTPGMMLVGKALVDENADPTDDEVRAAIGGNICRCTGYMNIVKAIQAAAAAQSAATTEPANA